jgi:hypothetical protein
MWDVRCAMWGQIQGFFRDLAEFLNGEISYLISHIPHPLDEAFAVDLTHRRSRCESQEQPS